MPEFETVLYEVTDPCIHCIPHLGAESCPCRKPYPAWQSIENRTMIVRNEGSLQAHWMVVDLIRSRVMLEAEIWMLR